MRTNIKSILAAALLTTMVAGCAKIGDFGDINLSPNSPSQPNTAMLFTYASLYPRNFVMTSVSYDPWPAFYAGYLAECKNNQYGGLTTTVDFNTAGYYLYCMKHLNEIVRLASDPETNTESYVAEFGSLDNQIAIATTYKCFIMMTLTDILGPLPYSEAFKGESDDIWTPKFDSQQDIYTALNQELEAAYAKFDMDGEINGKYDIFYGGDIEKWKKFNATVRMLMAIKLSDVDPSTGKTRFAKAFADGGLEEGDDFCFTFSQTTNAWLYDVGNLDYAQRNLMFTVSDTFVEALKEYKDPRLFTYCDLNGYLGAREGDPKDFNAYKGVTLGLPGNPDVLAMAGAACSVAQKYCEKTATYGLITAARALLVEAEAAQRGWISASASSLYEAGIAASFAFTDADGLDAYIAAHPLPSDGAEAIKEIVMQRFLDGFMTDHIEVWADWRRTNVPERPSTAHQVSENGHNCYPYRMQYYDTDKTSNKAQYDACISTFFGGNDDRWNRLWWDTEDNE